MNHIYVIALTFNEFQVLYSSSEIRIARNRPLAIPTDIDGNPNFLARSGQEVLERATHFDVEAEHSIIIGVIEEYPPDQTHNLVCQSTNPISPDVFYLPIRSFRSFHSLTERGGRILAGRLEGFDIDLRPPLFENDVIQTIHEWSIRRAVAGGSALVEMITGDDSFRVEPNFAEKAIAALNLAHSGQQLPIKAGTFLDNLLCYERHEALPREDIAFLMDLGLVLKDFIEDETSQDPLSSFRDLVKALNNSDSTLSALLNLPDLKDVLAAIKPISETAIPLTLSTLFIRWKHMGLNSSGLDLALISSDIQDANKTHSPEDLKSVLWLFGLYWGIDRLVPDYYHRIPGEYDFLLKGKKIEHKTINLCQVQVEEKKSPKKKQRTTRKRKETSVPKGELPKINGKDAADQVQKPQEKKSKILPQKINEKIEDTAIPRAPTPNPFPGNPDESEISETSSTEDIKVINLVKESKKTEPPKVILKGGKKSTKKGREEKNPDQTEIL